MTYRNGILLCLGILTAVGAVAQDPFSRQRRQADTNTDAQASLQSPLSPQTAKNPCQGADEASNGTVHVAAETAFSQLKAVGMLHSGQTATAFFIDEQGRFLDATVGDYVAAEGYKLRAIHKKYLQFERYENGQCQRAVAFNLPL